METAKLAQTFLVKTPYYTNDSAFEKNTSWTDVGKRTAGDRILDELKIKNSFMKK